MPENPAGDLCVLFGDSVYTADIGGVHISAVNQERAGVTLRVSSHDTNGRQGHFKGADQGRPVVLHAGTDWRVVGVHWRGGKCEVSRTTSQGVISVEDGRRIARAIETELITVLVLVRSGIKRGRAGKLGAVRVTREARQAQQAVWRRDGPAPHNSPLDVRPPAEPMSAKEDTWMLRKDEPITSLPPDDLALFVASRRATNRKHLRNWDNIKPLIVAAILKTLEDWAANRDSRELAMRVALVIFVLFTPHGKSQDEEFDKTAAANTARAIAEGDWSRQTVGAFPCGEARRQERTDAPAEKMKERRDLRVRELIGAAQLAKAAAVLTSTVKRLNLTEDDVRRISRQFPSQGREATIEQAEIFPVDQTDIVQEEDQIVLDFLNKFQQDKMDMVEFSVEQLADTISRCSTLVGMGADRNCAEHWQWILGPISVEDVGERKKNARVKELLCAFCCAIAKALLPVDVSSFLGAGCASQLPKSSGTGDRTIQATSFLRKITAKMLYTTAVQKAEPFFEAAGQTAFVKDAIQTGYRKAAALMEASPDRDAVLHDLTDAFPYMQFFFALVVCFTLWKSLATYFAQWFKPTSKVVSVFAQKGESFALRQLDGAQQGDVFGTFLFCIASAPFFSRVKTVAHELDPGGSFSAFADDTILIAYMNAQLEALKLFKLAKWFGFHMSVKTVVLLGTRGGDRQQALDDRDRYIMAGVAIENIHLHPDDVEDRDKPEQRRRAGATLLGGPIGRHPDYTEAWLQKKLLEEQELAAKYALYDDPHGLLCLVRSCFATRIWHLARILDSNPTAPFGRFLDAYEDRVLKPLIAQGVLRIREEDISDSCWQQLRLIIAIPSVRDFASAAYLAATKRALPELEKVKGRNGESVAANLRDIDATVGSRFVSGRLPHEEAYSYAMRDFSCRALPSFFDRGDGQPPFQCTGLAFLGDDIFAGKCAKGFLPKGEGRRITANQLQAYLTSFVTQHSFETLAKTLSPEDAKRLISSLEGGNAFAIYLPLRGKGRTPNQCAQYSRRFTLSTAQRFRIALLMHAGVPLGKGQSQHSGPNSKYARHHDSGILWGNVDLLCTVCKEHVDAHGLHFACSCGAEKAKSAVHEACADCLVVTAQEGGLAVNREVRSGIGRNGIPWNRDSDVWYKHSPKDNGKHYALDVKTFSTTSGVTCIGKTGWDIISENATAASTRWKYADDIERATNRAAVERNAANNHDFTPFISDCFGGLHSTAREHLAWQSTVCPRTGFWEGKQPQLYRAYCKRLSVATADALATIVEQRVSTLLRPAGDRGIDDDHFPIAHFGFLTAEQARTNILQESATAAWPHPDVTI